MNTAKTEPHIVTLVAMAATGAMATNVFLPSLPAIARHFDTEYHVVQLMVSLFLASTAIVQVIAGPLSDRFGRRPVVLVALAMFCVTTVAAIYAPTIEILLVLRVIQASSAAGMVISRAVVRDTVTHLDQAASRIAYVVMGMSLVPMLGPIAGGVLDEFYGWQSTFWLMLVLAMVTIVMIWLDLPETNRHRSSSMGTQFRAYPELLRSPLFWGYSLTSGFSSATFFAFLGGGPFIATAMLGMSPSGYGIYFAIVSLGYMTGSYVSGRFSQRFGVNRMIVVGNAISLAGVVLSIGLYLVGVFTPLSLFGPMAVVTLGNGMTLPNSNAGLVSVKPHLAGSASGLGGTFQLGTGAILSYLAGALLSPTSGPMPLLLVMLGAIVCGVAGGFWLMRAARASRQRN